MHQASNRLILLKLANERKNLTNPALLQLRSCAQIMSLSIGSVSLVGFGGSVGETKFTIITKCLPERTAVISQHYTTGFPTIWLLRSKTSAEIPYWWWVNLRVCVVLAAKFSTDQKHNSDLVSGASSGVWKFCARSSDIISRRNKWWRPEMSAIFLG